MEIFSFSPPKNLSEEGEWLLGVSLFECINSVFKITNENGSFSITTPDHWNSESAEKTIDEQKKILDIRYGNDIELHVEQVRKKGIILLKDCSLSSLGTFENEIIEELKNSKNNDLEAMVYRFQLTYDEIIDILDPKYIPTAITLYYLVCMKSLILISC